MITNGYNVIYFKRSDAGLNLRKRIEPKIDKILRRTKMASEEIHDSTNFDYPSNS